LFGRRRFLRVVVGGAAFAAACGGNGGGSNTVRTTPAAVRPNAAAGGRGLLLPRDQRLLLRDMQTGVETVIKRAPVDHYYTYPRWSPDGRQFAYALDQPYTGQPTQQWGSDIILAASDGNGERTVLKRPASGFKIEGLAWVPDGSAMLAGIVETTIRDGRFISQEFRIERVELASGARTPLVPAATYPAVSPDGARIAYTSYGEGDTPGGLWIARPDGADARLIVPTTGKFATAYYPRYSPDGRTIAFSATTLGSGQAPQGGEPAAQRWPWQPKTAAAHGLPMDVWTVSADGGEPSRLTSFLEDEPYPAWSPDGSTLAIVATGGLYTVPATGGEPKKLGLGGTLVQIDWR
jgi:dipeptidyl aminopeptidase/acylaminoacyl peptidase